ncbi:MAG: tetraacyldisaccharide 4'-kinase [Candidatus Omnitrophica bacterium]|nr:tetraacyldisaccharide 4'-kinase [Candidatus Omnitrophota bacterium]
MKTSRPFFSTLYRSFLLRQQSAFWNILSGLLLPLSVFYLIINLSKQFFFPKKRYPFKIISVGNITTGGTGKTTLVEFIATKLQEKYARMIIISSGVGSLGHSPRVAAGWEIRKPKFFGDEVTLLAQSLPRVLFLQGKGKKNLLDLAEANIKPEVCILDDGMQCYMIRKDKEIALIDALQPLGNRLPIPAGLLRDLPCRLKKVDAILVTNTFLLSPVKRKKVIALVTRYRKPIFFMNYQVAGIIDPSDRQWPSELLEGKLVLAFAGIGQPFAFFSLVRELAPRRLYPVAYPDHFDYQSSDIFELIHLGNKFQVDYWLTTLKDAVKVWQLQPGEKFLAVRIIPKITDGKGNPVSIDTLLKVI